MRAETESVIFGSSANTTEKTFRGLNLKTGALTLLSDFPGGYVTATTGASALFTVFNHDGSARLYRLDAERGATLLYEALEVAGAFSPDGRFVAVDAAVGSPWYRNAAGVTLLMDAEGRVMRELGRGGHGVLWLSEDE